MRKSEVILPLNMFVDLKRAGPVPLYFQVSSTIEEAIRSGQIQPGSRLENEVSLGERLGLSRPTIRRAIQELVDKGLLVRRRGIGTQVVHGQVTRGVELTSLFDDLVRSGQHPSTTVLTCEIEPAEASIAEELMISPGSPVLKIERIRAADGVPVGLLTNWLTTVDLGITKSDLEEHGLYQILRGRAVAIRVAKQRIGARKATNQEADRLDISHGEAVLTMDRTSFNSAGVAIEFGHHCYRPDLYSFEATLVEK
jgi:DNA-binding GntR family transcriptional regulator